MGQNSSSSSIHKSERSSLYTSSSKPGTSNRPTTTATIATQTQTTPESISTTSIVMMTPADEDGQKIDMMEDFIVQYTNDTPSEVPTDVQRQESDTPLEVPTDAQQQESDTPLGVSTDVQRQASNTPLEVLTDVQRQTSDTSVQSHSSVQRQISDIIVPTPVYEQQASAFSADGSEKLVVLPEALLPGDPGLSKLQNDMIDNRELMNELRRSVDALRESTNIGAQQGVLLTQAADSGSEEKTLQRCQQTVVNNIEKTMSQLQTKLNDLDQRLTAVEKRVGTKQ